MNSFDWIGKWAVYSPTKVAVAELSRELSLNYQQLNDYAEQFAANLHYKYGLKKGDHLAIFAPFSVELIALFGACQKAGFCLVPLNLRLAIPELEEQIHDSEAKLLIANTEDQQKLASISIPKIDWEDLNEKTDEVYQEEVAEDDSLFILYSSGSTGKPKGVIYTHKMLFWNSINTQLRLELRSSDKTVGCMPSFHTGGWNVLTTPLLHQGATIYLTSEFDAETVIDQLVKTESTIFWGVPTMLKLMEESESFKDLNLEHIRYFVVGGEALPVKTIETWRSKGVLIRQGYGLSEVGPNVTSLHQDDVLRKRGSIGFYNFYIEGKIVNDKLQECKVGEKGELWLAGPCVTPKYWKNESETQKSREGKWFKTGDIVQKDEEGYLYIVGRKKEMYISGGENVYPAEVERVLRKHPSIKDVAVVGIADSKWGETGAALIVPAKEDTLTEEEVKSFCKQHLAKFKIPKAIQFAVDLPKNDAGKIDKRRISQLF